MSNKKLSHCCVLARTLPSMRMLALCALLVGCTSAAEETTSPTSTPAYKASPSSNQEAVEGRWCGVLCEPGTSIECQTAAGATDKAWCTDSGAGWYTCGSGRQGGVAEAGETCGEGYACKREPNGGDHRCWSVCEPAKDLACEGGAVGLTCKAEAAKRAAEACKAVSGGYCCPDDSLTR